MQTETKNLQHEELIRRAQNGDYKAYRKYYKIIEPSLKAIATKYLRYIPYSYKDDLIQEGSIGLMHGIKKYRPENRVAGAKPETYIFRWMQAYIRRATKRIIRNQRRYMPEEHIVEGEVVIYDEGRADSQIKLIELVDLVDSFRSHLVGREREVWDARCNPYTKNSLVEVAQKMGVSRETIRSTEIKMRRRFRGHLQRTQLAETTSVY